MCAGTLVLLGLAVLAGWTVGNVRLVEVLPGRVSMKANTAVCFMAAGLGVMAELLGDRRWMRVFGAAVLLVGGLTVVEYATGRSLGLDQLMFHDGLQPIWPGRMARLSAVNFCLSGGALLLLAGGRRMWRWGYGCVAALLVAAMLSMVGMVYGVPLLYGADGRQAGLRPWRCIRARALWCSAIGPAGGESAIRASSGCWWARRQAAC